MRMMLGRGLVCHSGPLGSVREASNGFVLPSKGQDIAIIVPSLVGTVQFKNHRM